MRENFYDPETASSSGATPVPSQPSTIPSPRTMPCRDSGLPHDTRNIVGASGNVFERPPAQEGRLFTFLNNSKILASSSQELRPDITGTTKRPESDMKREPLNTSIPVPHFQRGGGKLNHTVGTCSHGGTIDYPRLPVNFKTEVCSKSADPHLTMHWIKEVEMAKSIGDLMT